MSKNAPKRKPAARRALWDLPENTVYTRTRAKSDDVEKLEPTGSFRVRENRTSLLRQQSIKGNTIVNENDDVFIVSSVIPVPKIKIEEPLPSPVQQNILHVNQRALRKPGVKRSLSHRIRRPSHKFLDPLDGNDLGQDEYLEDIIEYLLQRERIYVIEPKFYYDYQQEDRVIIVNWLHLVQQLHRIRSTVLFSTVRMYDIFTAKTAPPRNHHQLAAAVLLFLTSKMDMDIKLFAIDMLKECGNCYTKGQFARMLAAIFKHFHFDICLPNPEDFVEYYFRKLRVDSCFAKESAYLILECYTLSPLFSTVVPSKLAAAAAHLAITTCNPEFSEWDRLKGAGGYYPLEELQTVESEMIKQLKFNQLLDYEFTAPFHKYEGSVGYAFMKKICDNGIVFK